MDNLLETRKIAKSVRAKRTHFALTDKSRQYDFHGMQNLSCMCLFASTVLAETLRRKVDPEAMVAVGQFTVGHDGRNHCWVVSLGKVIDITATQFGMHAVEIHDAVTNALWTEAERITPGSIPEDWPWTQSPTKVLLAKFVA